MAALCVCKHSLRLVFGSFGKKSSEKMEDERNISLIDTVSQRTEHDGAEQMLREKEKVYRRNKG